MAGILDNLKRRGLKDVLNPKKWKVYILSKLRSWLFDKSPEQQLADAEQIVYRAGRCPECVMEGSCIVCGCPMPDSLLEPDNWCEGGRWNETLPYKEWEKFKLDNNLKIRLYA